MKKKILILLMLLVPSILLVGCGYTEKNNEVRDGIQGLSVEKYTDKETGKKYIIFESVRGLQVKEITNEENR